MISKNQQKLNSGFHAKSEPKEILEGIDLSGKTAIVTGGYSGIGLETTRALAEAGANVFVPARRVDDAKKALDGIIDEVNISKMDLADISSIKKYTQEFINEIKSLNILINNAGIMACPESKTSNGWDLQFAVNHIGHFVFHKRAYQGHG